MKYDCIIIGGGASGLMLSARMKVNRGLVLEGNSRPGAKLLITGGGQCNLTHAGSIKDFLPQYSEAARTLRKCLYRHSNEDMLKWFAEIGLPTVQIEEKYFPKSMRASDVRDVLVREAEKNGWKILTKEKVKALAAANAADVQHLSEEGTCRREAASASWIVRTADSVYETANAVVASGGITYPETGSDGSMFEVLKKLGVEVSGLRPALAPVYVKDYPFAELSGVSVRDVSVAVSSSDALNNSKDRPPRLSGDLLFTHRGFSGPVIMKASRYCNPGDVIRISYNCSLDEMPRRLRRLMEDRSRGPSGDIRTGKLAELLKSDEFIIDEVDPRGFVTRGGISLDEINTSDMQLRRFPGLYAVGEVIDADGFTGGYNLQLCYSTACAAADGMSRHL